MTPAKLGLTGEDLKIAANALVEALTDLARTSNLFGHDALDAIGSVLNFAPAYAWTALASALQEHFPIAAEAVRQTGDFQRSIAVATTTHRELDSIDRFMKGAQRLVEVIGVVFGPYNWLGRMSQAFQSAMPYTAAQVGFPAIASLPIGPLLPDGNFRT